MTGIDAVKNLTTFFEEIDKDKVFEIARRKTTCVSLLCQYERLLACNEFELAGLQGMYF